MENEFLLSEAQAMAPLVRAILRDSVEAYAFAQFCQRRAESLFSRRRAPDYQTRCQYYDALRKLGDAEKRFDELQEELVDLGVSILDPVKGIAAFPFLWAPKPKSKRVRRAMFLLKLSDDAEKDLSVWCFLGEKRERRIPRHWMEEFTEVLPADEVGTQ